LFQGFVKVGVAGLPARLPASGRAVKGKALHVGLPTSTSRPLYTRMCASQDSGSHGHCPCDRGFFFLRQTISVHPSLGGCGLDSKEKPTVKSALTVATRSFVLSLDKLP
jgi:hypothetical protein